MGNKERLPLGNWGRKIRKILVAQLSGSLTISGGELWFVVMNLLCGFVMSWGRRRGSVLIPRLTIDNGLEQKRTKSAFQKEKFWPKVQIRRQATGFICPSVSDSREVFYSIPAEHGEDDGQLLDILPRVANSDLRSATPHPQSLAHVDLLVYPPTDTASVMTPTVAQFAHMCAASHVSQATSPASFTPNSGAMAPQSTTHPHDSNPNVSAITANGAYGAHVEMREIAQNGHIHSSPLESHAPRGMGYKGATKSSKQRRHSVAAVAHWQCWQQHQYQWRHWQKHNWVQEECEVPGHAVVARLVHTIPVIGRGWLGDDSEEEVTDLRTPLLPIMPRTGLLSPHSKLLHRRVMSPSPDPVQCSYLGDATNGMNDDVQNERAARYVPVLRVRGSVACPSALLVIGYRTSSAQTAHYLRSPQCQAPTGDNNILSRSRASLIREDICDLLVEAFFSSQLRGVPGNFSACRFLLLQAVQ
ncbi:hypothetical protein JB92DRAFT_2838825 [Gautieria morchelliformis]|nr:hypothetical protein JB92DRAFT_2838825 [Gautieria morchelliformis]